jgi:hypothetical protein
MTTAPSAPSPYSMALFISPSTKGDDGNSHAVWRARLVINMRAKRLLSLVTGNYDDDNSDDD